MNKFRVLFLLTGSLLLVGYACSRSRHHASDQNKKEMPDQQKSTETDVWSDFDKKETWFMKDAMLLHSIDELPDDFITFYGRFISDKEYQKKHIRFPILAAVGECDTTIILGKVNWEIFSWDFRKEFYNPLDSNIIYLNKNKFYFKNIRKEIGELFRMGFEKTEGEWFMTLYLLNNC